MKKQVVLLFLLCGSMAWAQKAVLVEDSKDNSSSAPLPAARTENKRGWVSDDDGAAQETRSSFGSTYEMRSKRRVGIGIEAAGEMGLVGVAAELNFAVDDSARIGFGGGPRYSSITGGWRHTFGGKSLAAFTEVNFSHWYNSNNNGSISTTVPSYLAEKFLSGTELTTGQFELNLLAPEFGLQYNLLYGSYVGSSVYAKIMLLVDIDNFQNVPTGAFGVTYYF